MKYEPSRYPLMLIIWDDHCGDVGGWNSKEDMGGRYSELSLIYSVGWLYGENEAAYTLCGAYDHENEEWGSVQIIGKGMVREVRTLRKAGANKKPASESSAAPAGVVARTLK
jgi:hypothetical protein